LHEKICVAYTVVHVPMQATKHLQFVVNLMILLINKIMQLNYNNRLLFSAE
jgi:hypothetical protein